MSEFTINCSMSCCGDFQISFSIPVSPRETIDSLFERATTRYMQQIFPPIKDRNAKVIARWRLRPCADTPYIYTASGARYPQQGSIRDEVNTCDKLRRLLCDLNSDENFPTYVNIDLETF